MLNLVFTKYADISLYSQQVLDYLSDNGIINEDIIFNIRLVISELAGNVIKHSKCVAKLCVLLQEHDIVISIDGGNCFNFSEQSELPKEECECGRGIFIVKKISKSLEYLEGGKKAVCTLSKCSIN